jgi:hypothetical protein
MAKRFDPKAKARKQKIVAAALGVVLLGVLVFQGPTILGLFKGSSSTAASEPAPAPAPTPLAPATPTPGVASAPATAPAATGSAELVDSDPAPTPATGQLVSFDRFESKDPFLPQIAKGSGGGAAPVPDGPSKDGALPLDVTDPSPEPTATYAPAPAASVRTATISVNGVSSQVAVSGTFPEGEPIFKLVSVTKTSVKVGIVDGAYATGSQTIALKKGGKPVTLMNTADGTTYVLRLLSVG